MSTLFISDLHLQALEPRIIEIFECFMLQQAPTADAVYILGDLFEAWLGDDDRSRFASHIRDIIKRAAKQTPCYFMRGNRDVAIGQRFAEETGITLLDDPCLVKIYDKNVLLMHGDLLCTDDVKYQAFRKKVYDPKFRKRFLSLPLFVRRLIAAWARRKSRQHTGTTDLSIQDVNQQTVEKTVAGYDTQILIHGHTHRPAHHQFTLNNKHYQRIVLSAWHDGGHVLSIDKNWKINESNFS